MPAIDDLTAVRRLLDVPAPPDRVTTAGREQLDQLIRHETTGRRVGRARRAGQGRGRRRVLVAATAAAAAVAAVAATLVLAHPQNARPAAAQSAGDRPAGAAPAATGSVKQAILTAVGSAGDDVMHLTVTTTGGAPIGRGVVQYWWWPARPASGQQVHLIFGSASAREEVTFTEPAVTPSDGQLKQLPASGYLLDPVDKKWEPVTQYTYGNVFAATTTDLLDQSYLRGTLLARSTVINAHATVAGQPAIEINVPAVTGLTVTFWVDAQTYLPLRQLKIDAGTNYPTTRKVYDFQFLPATQANLAMLAAPVPAGYQQHDWP